VLHSLAAGAQRYFSPLSIANLEMRAIADELDVVASALFAEGDEVVVRDRAASVKHLGWGNLASRHYPLLPAGSVFLAPLSDAEAANRIEKAKPALGARDRQSVLNQLECARRHGFVVGIQGNDLPAEHGFEQVTHFPSDIPDRSDLHVSFMAAPVMGAAGDVVMAISLQGLPWPMTREMVLATGRKLREVCQRVTNFITAKRGEELV
jgi:DNA-binding IclR family transcriptional regulator